MKSDTKIGIFVVLLLVAVVVVLLGREVMNRKHKPATEAAAVDKDKPAEGTDGAYSEDGNATKVATDGIKDELGGKPPAASPTPVEGAPKVAEAPKPLVFDPTKTGLEGTVSQPKPPEVITEVPPVHETPAEYVVQRGDIGTEIAKKVYGKRKLWTAIKTANPGINENNLKVGTKLVIPPAPAESPKIAESSTTPAPIAGGKTYTVKKGDYLEKIAIQVYGKRKFADEIKKVNPGLDERHLKINMVINLPEGPSAPAAAEEHAKASAKHKTAKVDPWTQRGATRLVTSVPVH